ncbi:MAG: pyridoxal-dependent decarboxylase, partial [Gemmatimonadaceae bacterium]
MTLDELLAAIEEDGSRESAALLGGIAADYLAAAGRDDAPVSRWEEVSETSARYDEPLPEGGKSLDEVARRVRDTVVNGANWLAHPMAMGHQVSPPLPASIWSDAIISSLNNSLAVREMSPTITPLERRVVRWMCDAIGFGSGSGGTFTSGGTEATLTALVAARAQLLPNAWEDGIGTPAPVVLCGAHAHYAVSRAVGVIGLGVRQLLTVPAVDYRMDPRGLRERLEALRAEGRTVLAVVGTAGHTATGAFDDFDALADVCAEHGTWLHVDGAHGAS